MRSATALTGRMLGITGACRLSSTRATVAISPSGPAERTQARSTTIRPRRVGTSRKRSSALPAAIRPRSGGCGTSRSERSTATATGIRRGDGTLTVSTASSSSPM